MLHPGRRAEGDVVTVPFQIIVPRSPRDETNIWPTKVSIRVAENTPPATPTTSVVTYLTVFDQGERFVQG